MVNNATNEKICQKATKATAIRKKGLDRKAAKKSALVKWKKNLKLTSGLEPLCTCVVFSMPNGKVDEGEMALIIGEGGLTKTTLARRKRIRANFQAFTMENYQKDLAGQSKSSQEQLDRVKCNCVSKNCVNM